MSKINESGHAVNVSNFNLLDNFCTNYGPEYNPTQPIITLKSFIEIKTNALTALKDVDIKFAKYTQSVNHRQKAYKPLDKLATRIINMLDASGASSSIVKDVRTVVRKIQGNTPSSKIDTNPDKVVDNKISTSQQSFANRAANFQKVIELLKSEATYKPNKSELTVETLEKNYISMLDANNEVQKAYVDLRSARNNRDQVLYNREKGLVQSALEAKKYIKAIFGSSSQQFNNVYGLKFRNVINPN